MYSTTAIFTPHDNYMKILKAGKSIVPKPNINDVSKGYFTVRMLGVDTFHIYRKGKYIGAYVIGGGFASTAGYGNMDQCAALAVTKYLKKFAA